MPFHPRGSGRSPLLRRPLAVLGAAAVAVLAAAGPAAAAPSDVKLAELRVSGPSGGNDEFVELLNTGGAPVDISGWRLEGCAAASGAPSLRVAVPAGTTLAAGEHYLFTNTAASGYSGSVPGDASYSTGISETGGVRIADGGGSAIDGIASSDGATDQCREGTGVALNATGGFAYERKAAGAGLQDTNDNAADFFKPGGNGNPQNKGGGGPDPGPTVTKIHDVQGAGASSPKSGQNVTIEGVVTGWDDEIGADYERTYPEDAGIFVQEESADADADPATSEGIYVGYVRDRPNYPIGTKVKLNGQVKEKFGQTIISETNGEEPVKDGTAEVPAPVEIDTAAADGQNASTRPYYESLEGMRARLAVGTANVGGTSKFGELFLEPGEERDRLFRGEASPGLIAADDDAGSGDPDNPHVKDPSATLVEGDLFDQVQNLVGPVSFNYDNYRILPQVDVKPTVVDGPTEFPYNGLPAAGANELRVASFNVENYLRPGRENDLHTITQEEYDNKRGRIADVIDRLLKRPDIVTLQEVDNQEALDDLVESLGGGYTGYLEEGNDSRGIDVAILVRDGLTASNERQLGKDATGPSGVTCSDVAGGLFDRPPLAVDIEAADGTKFTVLSNHFSSKGAPDTCRGAQAAYVRDQVKAIEDGGGEAMVTGDLNSFEDEVALTTLEDGTTSLDNQWDEAPAENRYSYQYQGRLQTLDHVVVTDGIAAKRADFRYAHVDNDYHERPGVTAGGRPDGHHVSDHDPPVFTLALTPPDETPPDTYLLFGPSGSTQRDTAAFVFIGSERGVTYECKLDSGEWTRCDDNYAIYTGLSKGAHKFSVRAIDAAGNADPTPAVREWRVTR